MTGTETKPRLGATVRRPVAITVLLVVVTTGMVVGPAVAVEQADDGPSVDSVDTTRSEGNLTVSIRGSNLTEVDVTGVPDGWAVLDHEDDFGVYADQLANESRVVWLWRIPVTVNVSVTFSVPEDPSYDMRVVPWEGTDRGEAVAVQRLDTPTPTPEPATTAMPTTRGTDTDTGQSGGEATPTELQGVSPVNRTTTADGPGFGAVGVLVAAVLAGAAAASRRD